MTDFQKEIDLLIKSRLSFEVTYEDKEIHLLQSGTHIYKYDWRSEKFLGKEPI